MILRKRGIVLSVLQNFRFSLGQNCLKGLSADDISCKDLTQS